jgi:hypothetical protein
MRAVWQDEVILGVDLHDPCPAGNVVVGETWQRSLPVFFEIIVEGAVVE